MNPWSNTSSQSKPGIEYNERHPKTHPLTEHDYIHVFGLFLLFWLNRSQVIHVLQKSKENQHLPKLPDELGKDVLQFGSEVPPHIVFDAPDSLHLNRVTSGINEGTTVSYRIVCIMSMPTMTVACDASVLGSMMKRMTLMKPKEALTISLVRDVSSRHTLCSSCSLVVTSIASEEEAPDLI